MIETSNINPKMLKFLPWLGAMAIFMQALDGTILNTSLPTIAKELGKSPLEIQSIIVSYTLTVFTKSVRSSLKEARHSSNAQYFHYSTSYLSCQVHYSSGCGRIRTYLERCRSG